MSSLTSLMTWDLSDLFLSESDPAIHDILVSSPQKAKLFHQKYRGRVIYLSTKELYAAYEELEDILTPYYKLSQFVSLAYSIDTSNHDLKKLQAIVDEVGSEISNLLLFFDLEIGSIPEPLITQHFHEIPQYSYSLKRNYDTAKYHLTEKEEQVLNLKSLTSADAFVKLYEELTSSFEFELEVDGVVKKMNGSELRALRQHPNQEVRKKAMALFFNRYKDHEMVLTHIFNYVVKDFNVIRKLRGYHSPISKRNMGNDLPDHVIDMLHHVTEDSYSLVSRYYVIKKKLLGLSEMTLADIYAPLEQSQKKYSFDEAKDLVLRGFKAFDSQFYDYANIMFTQNRIHAPVLPKKRGGAFCSSSVPGIYPYVMLNFLGRQRDVATMAHELGHAIHACFSSIQKLTNYHAILPLAETASVFSENIILDLMKKEETSKLGKQIILTNQLEDIFATSHRQNMFSRFEIQSHEIISKSLMSSQELCELYGQELKKMFGNSVVMPDEYKWEWLSIPHLLEYPFYVYSYNFGNLLVLALYQQYLEEGPLFIPKLKQILSMGASKSPQDILKVVGVDIEDRQFWEKSIKYIDSLITELELLIS